MFITVAICTYNRAELLRRTLDALAAMQVPEGVDWEVVVVNNNCTDRTDAVIAAFADRLPIREVSERQPGQSNARNRAIDVAKGDYIVWTDDDVVVDPLWIAAYSEAFRRWPEAALFGGPIIPRYEEPVARWVRESEPLLAGPYAIRNLGDEPIPLCVADGHDPYGANFAVRAAEQSAVRYNPDLGLGPSRRRIGDETDVIERLLKSGATGYWVPGARVEHCISRERQTVAYVARYFAGWGETVAFRRGRSRVPLLFGAPRWLWRRLASEWARYRIHRAISPGPIWVPHLKACSVIWGTIRYWRSAGG